VLVCAVEVPSSAAQPCVVQQHTFSWAVSLYVRPVHWQHARC
jgi:hypothetical protein